MEGGKSLRTCHVKVRKALRDLLAQFPHLTHEQTEVQRNEENFPRSPKLVNGPDYVRASGL